MAVTALVAELEDATTVVGTWNETTPGSTTTFNPYRASYQRGQIQQVAGGAGSHWTRSLPSAVTTQCIACRFGSGSSSFWSINNDVFFAVMKSGVPILGVSTTTSTGLLKLKRWNGATWDTLATGLCPSGSAIRLDMYIENFGATGRARVWLSYCFGSAPAQLFLDSGVADLATGTGATDFDGVYVCGTDPANGTASLSSNAQAELICAAEPTMRMSLVTCYPNAAGDVNQWTGAYTDVDEMNASTSDYTETGTAGKLFLANVTDLPSSTTLTPLGVQVTILAAKGTTGPTQIKIAIKTHGTVYYGGDITLTDAYVGYSYLWTVNPSTGITWTQAEITALQIGYESVA